MAILFDTTVGGASSNSYVTVDQFNDYTEKLIHTDDIPKSSQTTLIRKLLIAATEVVDSALVDSAGYVTTQTQNLEYPRVGIADRRGNAINENTIPQELIDAVSEMAIWLYQNNTNHAQNDNWDEVTSTEIAGTVDFTYDNTGKPSTLMPARVTFLLSRIGSAYTHKVNMIRRS